ncbi:recombinase family protein [Parasutterella sp.]|uniref:recombinase family protein n=1 Tax=Parasutterella sp. TaxID=2049037 RepID=UPI003AF1219B
MRNSSIVGYARVSSVEQNLDRQLVQLKAENVETVFVDKISGKNLDRPGFSSMMEYVNEGDTLVICSMDRLARSLMDLLNVTRTLQAKGVTVRFLKEKLELSSSGETSAISKFLMAMMGAVAEFERSLIRERQQQGIALAKARGVYKGRKPIDDERLAEAKRRIASGIPKTKVAKELKIGRTTLYKYLKEQT